MASHSSHKLMRWSSIFILLSVLLPVTASAQVGGRVLPIKRRDAALEAGEKYIDRNDLELKAKFEELRYPFAFKEIEKIQETTETAVVETPAEPELTDQEVLNEVASKFNATGTLQRGGKSYLIFHNGSFPEGGTIKINFKDTSYLVEVTNVTSSGYKLRLNDAVVSKTYGQSTAKGTIERTP